jgi:hypothetical protein
LRSSKEDDHPADVMTVGTAMTTSRSPARCSSLSDSGRDRGIEACRRGTMKERDSLLEEGIIQDMERSPNSV